MFCSVCFLTASAITLSVQLSLNIHLSSLKMFVHTCRFFVLLIHSVLCEWVEIPKIVSNKTAPESARSTTSIYDPALSTPFLRDCESSTPVNNLDVVNITGSPLSQEISDFPIITTYSTEQQLERETSDFDLEYDGASDQGFLPLLRMVQQKLLGYKFNLHSNKMSLLKHLRDQLLANAYERIANLWKQPHETKARGYKDDEDYHMDFPSNEGALMTIGFLTFAVFLIKLVIKLIHTLQYKKDYYGTTTTTAAPTVLLLRRKRDLNDEVAKISQYIDEYKYP